MAGREDYLPPVDFAREPVAERRRWIGRIFLFIFVILLAWLFWTKVIHTGGSENTPLPQQSELPAPV